VGFFGVFIVIVGMNYRFSLRTTISNDVKFRSELDLTLVIPRFALPFVIVRNE